MAKVNFIALDKYDYSSMGEIVRFHVQKKTQ